MKKLFGVLLLLLISVAAALWFRDQGGFVIVRMGEWTLEMSVILFIGFVLVTVVALYLLIGLLRRLFGLPRGVRRWWGTRKSSRARRRLIEGLIHTAEGRNAEAEKVLLKDIERSDAPMLHYMVAAVAAQGQGAADRRDRYLALADRSGRRVKLAVGLLQAQLQMEAGQWEQALATVSYLYERHPQHPRVLKLMMRCCIALKEWDRLGQLIPDLRRRAVVSEPELRNLELTAARYALEKASREGDRELDRAWSALGKGLREEDELLLLYARGLALHGRVEEAERMLRVRLQKRWSESLLKTYAGLELESGRLLAQLEKWLKERPEDAVLLHAAGRQCLRSQLWGRARSYFEAAVARDPLPETYQALGGILEQLGEVNAARDCFRKATELVTGQPTLAELTAADKAALARQATNSGR